INPKRNNRIDARPTFRTIARTAATPQELIATRARPVPHHQSASHKLGTACDGLTCDELAIMRFNSRPTVNKIIEARCVVRIGALDGTGTEKGKSQLDRPEL